MAGRKVGANQTDSLAVGMLFMLRRAAFLSGRA